MNRMLPLLLSLAPALFAAGCTTIGPDHERPAFDMPAGYRAAEGWKPAEPADHLPRGEWWRTYGDPVLDDLIHRVDRAYTGHVPAAVAPDPIAPTDQEHP